MSLNKIKELKGSLAVARFEYISNKVDLEHLETKLYNEWKKDNPKDRTAKDKVLGEFYQSNNVLKSSHLEYINSKLKYEELKDSWDLVKILLSRPDLVIDDIVSTI